MRTIAVREHDRHGLEEHLSRLEAYVARGERVPLSHNPGWLVALQRGLGHDPFCLEAVEEGETRGFLALAHIRSLLFGRYLVSLPYLNYGGVIADDNRVAALLIEHAVGLADRLNVRFLELRHECPVEHPALNQRMGHKVHMRLELPATTEELWDGLSAKVRNQIRKGQRCGLTVAWGGEELIPEFHAVFSHNMRDLGTPAYGQVLFRSVLQQFPEQAEICVVRAGGQAVAAALLLHGRGVSEVPSASSLRLHNDKNCNMLLYLNLLERSVLRGQTSFDFGRSTRDSNTYRFKKQWGAIPQTAEWQYYVRSGSATEMRPENPRYWPLIRVWRCLPVGLTRLIGPMIIRGIP